MAAEQSGICKRMPRVNWVELSVSVGSTSERAGTNNTSSKVSPSGSFSVIMTFQRYSLDFALPNSNAKRKCPQFAAGGFGKIR
jgi:hypothetical protein